jgi:hypothetical protein
LGGVVIAAKNHLYSEPPIPAPAEPAPPQRMGWIGRPR